MELSNRLQAVANMVTKGNAVADIGCDHGYVSIYLMVNHIAPKIVAMDVNQGPLDRAKEHIVEQGLTDKIEIRLSDGAKALQFIENCEGKKPCLEVDTILIAGMGGRLIQKILSDSMDKIKRTKEIILQPQSDIGNVRKFLEEQGFVIVEENMIFEDGKYYPMMKAVPVLVKEKISANKEKNQIELTKEQQKAEALYQFGSLLLQNRNVVLQQYLEQEQEKLNQIIEQLENKDDVTESTKLRLVELKWELEMVQLALTYY